MLKRRTVTLLFVLLLFLLNQPLAVQGKGQPPLPARPASSWVLERADAPPLFSEMSGRSLVLDADGHPHLAYGQDCLHYAWYDGLNWRYELADDSPGVGLYASLALDAAGYPHISYYDGLNGNLKYAYRDARGWHAETADSAGGVGQYTSLALDAAGRPHISYYDWTNGRLEYASRDTTGWQIESVDGGGVGFYTSLALDSQGYARIAYYDNANADLKYACQSATAYQDATGWHLETADTGSGVGQYTSLALDGAGWAHISHFDWANLDVRYTYQDETGWHSETAASFGDVGKYTSLALDSSGQPHLSYSSWLDEELYYAYRDNQGWHPAVVDRAARVGQGTALVLDASGSPHISYSGGYPNKDLRYAFKDDSGWHPASIPGTGDIARRTSLALDSMGYPHLVFMTSLDYNLGYAYQDAGGWHVEIIDSVGMVGAFASIEVDSAGYPHIGYQDMSNQDLRYALLDATGWHTETVDSVGDVGYHISLVLDSAGYPHMCHYDALNGDLKYTYRDGTGWHTEIPDAVGDVGEFPSLVLDPQGYPHISYRDKGNAALKYAYYTEPVPGSGSGTWHIEPVDYTAMIELDTSLSLDSAGHPHIAYYAEYPLGDLRYAYHDGVGWQITTLDQVGDVGLFASLAIDALDRVSLSYYDATSLDLKYAYMCTPVQSVQIAGPLSLELGATGFYTAGYAPPEASLPVTINWSNGEDGATAAYSWTMPGTYTVAVTASNDCGIVSGLLTVTVEGPSCLPVESVAITGPLSLEVGVTGLYTASYVPLTATQPVTLTWDSGAVGMTATYSWMAPGSYTITVSALNGCGSADATLAVAVRGPEYRVYLPVVVCERVTCQPGKGLEASAGLEASSLCPVTGTTHNSTFGLLSYSPRSTIIYHKK